MFVADLFTVLHYVLCFLQKYKKYVMGQCIYEYTFAAVTISISRITSPVTLACLFVTGRVINTVTATVVDTVVTICLVFTL